MHEYIKLLNTSEMSVEGAEYQISAVGTVNIVFTCTAASSDDSITISWRKDPAGYHTVKPRLYL